MVDPGFYTNPSLHVAHPRRVRPLVTFLASVIATRPALRSRSSAMVPMVRIRHREAMPLAVRGRTLATQLVNIAHLATREPPQRESAERSDPAEIARRTQPEGDLLLGAPP